MTSRYQGFLFMALGFTIWVAALSLLYAFQATGCAFAWHQISLGPISLLRAILVGLLILHAGALAWLLVECRRRSASARDSLDSFLWRASSWLSLAAVGATLWIAMAVPLRSICGQM